jgi:transposase
MLQFKKDQVQLEGPAGTLPFPASDEITSKLAMLFEGECEGGSVTQVAHKFGYSRQRYYQLLKRFQTSGAWGLQDQKTGPHHPSRRTPAVVRQIIRYLFLDRQASPAIVAQKLQQLGHAISLRSVERVIAEYGLQKKTPRRQSFHPQSSYPDLSNPTKEHRGSY